MLYNVRACQVCFCDWRTYSVLCTSEHSAPVAPTLLSCYSHKTMDVLIIVNEHNIITQVQVQTMYMYESTIDYSEYYKK